MTISISFGARLINGSYYSLMLGEIIVGVLGIVGLILRDAVEVYDYGNLSLANALIFVALALYILEVMSVSATRLRLSSYSETEVTHVDRQFRLLMYSLILKTAVFGGVTAIFFFIGDSVPREGLSALAGTWALILGVAAIVWMTVRTGTDLSTFKNGEAIRR